ncbi:MAG TPA: TAT-variant-translocated molybdopterin oxidoreductase [Steroidobacteraceae bacterium]|nr:TAT-variant-translocated molybdopterin oxidoreductase [Steroidobacteraceae bacterium]
MPPLKSGQSFDPAAARAELSGQSGPVLWRSLEELADNEAFRQWLRQEQPRLAEVLGLDRRQFLRTLGAALALAGVTACGRPPQNEIIPYVHAPVGQVDGLPRFFATALTRNGYAHGVLVENHMGRPTKIEGNPRHPASLGATDIFAQAAILQLWDPDRSQTVRHRGDISSWDDFAAALLHLTAQSGRNGGAGMHVLTGEVTSPTLTAQLDALLQKFPAARWHLHEPLDSGNSRAGARMAFGAPLSTRLHLDRARVILSLDDDFLCDPAAGVRHARDFAATRAPEKAGGGMSRLYVLESTPSITGAVADHRLPLESARIEAFSRALARRLGVLEDQADSINESAWLDAIVSDLQANHGHSLITVGRSQPAWIHAAAHAMNAALGNSGAVIEYSDPVERVPEEGASLAQLVNAIRAGSVDLLVMLDVNPAYDAPADLEFRAALKQVPHVVHLGLYVDESAELSEWHLPQAHALETWSDARAFDGTVTIGQPLIAPLYDGRSACEVMALLMGAEVQKGHDLVRRQWRAKLADEPAWVAALQAGLIADSAIAVRSASVRPDLKSLLAPPKSGGAPPQGGGALSQGGGAPPESSGAPPQKGRAPSQSSSASQGGLELLFRGDPTIEDGRWSNNAWLQELPKPLTQLTWDNAVLISPSLAAERHLSNGELVELRLQGRSLRGPVWITPGQAARSVTIHLGYGRRRSGQVGTGQGFDAYALRSSSGPWRSAGLQILATGERYELAGTQQHFQMEGRDVLRVGTLADFQTNPRFATAHDRYPDKPPSLYPDYPPGEYAWGLSIDLNACIGCKACTIACQAENNIPTVGRDQVRRGREMHWIRVDRYYEGHQDNPHTYSQPVPCMMCEHAPCELVCPVDATVHDSEGLNVQIYNRCVGTRFCSNNCPYKVRRFNFLQYVQSSSDTLLAQRNPEVTVRRRGVMEKCTYCIQRIEAAHIEADKQDRRIGDGEVLTACQAVCPTQAIVFGDLSDGRSQVAQAKASARHYVMLGELNTRPRTSYLARVRNPNPSLEQG